MTLDDKEQRIIDEQDVVYHNLSPNTLRYIRLQLDQNRYRSDSDDMLTRTAPDFSKFAYSSLADMLERADSDGGVYLGEVRSASGALDYTVNRTLMRIELPPGEQFHFSVTWEHNIVDATAIRSRGGYEYLEQDDNYIYEIAQWYPRLVSYTDYKGWNKKQFLGRGEFTLELGNFDVAITVPTDHVVAATGVLQNPEEVLTEQQQVRYDKVSDAELSFIVTPEEARANEASRSRETKTWRCV